MSAQVFAKGDKVKVTLVGTVTNIVPYGDERFELRIEDADGVTRYVSPHRETIEKIEPKAREIFGPGDVLRGKLNRGIYFLTHEGTFFASTQNETRWFKPNDPDEYTSDGWERVEVG